MVFDSGSCARCPALGGRYFRVQGSLTKLNHLEDKDGAETELQAIATRLTRCWARRLGRLGAIAANARRSPEDRRRIASLGGKAAARAMTGQQLGEREKGAAAAKAKRERSHA